MTNFMSKKIKTTAKRIVKTVIIAIIAMFIVGVGVVNAQSKQKVAVYVTGGNDINISKVLGSKIVQAIIENGKYSAVERTDAILYMLRKEQVYQHSGHVDDNQIGKLGKELGVDYIAVAEIVEAFGEKYISARLIDATLAEAIKFADVYGDMNSMASLVKMSGDVASQLLGSGGTNKNTTTTSNSSNFSETSNQQTNNSLKNIILNDTKQYYCDGVYPGVSWEPPKTPNFFSYDLKKLSRNNFEISFEFFVGEHKNHWTIMLSSSYRVLGFYLENDGSTQISTNNQEHYYPLKAKYKLNTWHKVVLYCQNGLLTVKFDNNPVEMLAIEIDTIGGDNKLSSVNYSNAKAFKGYLRNIIVKTE